MVISSMSVGVVLQPSVGRIYFAAFSPCECEIEGALEMYCRLVVAVEEGLVSGCCKRIGNERSFVGDRHWRRWLHWAVAVWDGAHGKREPYVNSSTAVLLRGVGAGRGG